MKYNISQVSQIVQGSFLQQQDNDMNIEHLLTDSRKLLFPETTLFFAIEGPRRNGNQYTGELYDKGVRNFIVDTSFGFAKGEMPDANIIQVEGVVGALQRLASYHRAKFNYPVIGITGSNGKTIVKEWLFQLLHTTYNIVRSPKSYNSQIGVPLSVWEMNDTHTLGIFEAGISQPGEMEKLFEIIHPTIGVFTNLGEAHSVGFESMQQKLEEKIKLFMHAEVVIFNEDEREVEKIMAPGNDGDAIGNKHFKTITWSRIVGTYDRQGVLKIFKIIRQDDNTTLIAMYDNREISVKIPFQDEASIQNAITCWCVLLYLKISDEAIGDGMYKLRPIEMRLELKMGINNCSVINDSYSADINSLVIALDFIEQQKQHSRRTVILSDILESGISSRKLYRQVAAILQQKNIDCLIGIGEEITERKDSFQAMPESLFFSSTEAFIKHFPVLHFQDETILLKGARKFGFEQISHLLEQKSHQTILEINLHAITHNLKVYQQALNPGVKIMAMVKAFSYGSGSFEIANLLQFQKVDYLAVAYADEGVELRKAGITLPIMVMNAEEISFPLLVQYQLEPELYSTRILDAFEDYLKQTGTGIYPVHIKLDTGMHRLGFEPNQVGGLCEKIRNSQVLKIQSVFSHLAGSNDQEHDEFTLKQLELFNEGCNQIAKEVLYTFIKHIANTSAIHRHKNLQLDMVRLGIGLYGVDNNKQIAGTLKNVSTLKTTIAQVKKVKAGESIGYSRTGVAQVDSMIATVRIGYADGYPRILGNGIGKMAIGGVLAPVIGNICMDMTMLDITGIDAEEGDKVIVFGEILPVQEVAGWAQTIPYEILTGISQRVRRIYYEES